MLLAPTLNRYEQSVTATTKGSKDFKSLVAGASRVVRLARVHENTHLKTIWNTGASVIGPTLLFFVWWVLEESKKQNIKRLYFVARDGQIMLKTAKIIAERWGYNVDCRYLYGSREAWFFPSITEIGELELHWIFGPRLAFFSINLMCSNIQIEPGEIKDLLQQYGFEESAWDKNLSKNERNTLRRFLQEPSIQEKILKNSSLALKDTAGFLKQEGLLDNVNFALVDIGWSARSQVGLSRILEKAQSRPQDGLKGFYFGLNPAKQIYKNDQLFTFFFDFSKSLKRVNLNNHLIYETFASGDHGKTIGYKEEEGGKFIPVFKTSENENGNRWGIKLQQESIVQFVDEFTKHYSPDTLDLKTNYALLDSILQKFILKPTFEEAETYGQHLIASDVTEQTMKEIAPKIQFSGLLKHYFSDTWLPGSLSRSKLPFRRILGKVYQLKDLAINIFIYLLKR